MKLALCCFAKGVEVRGCARVAAGREDNVRVVGEQLADELEADAAIGPVFGECGISMSVLLRKRRLLWLVSGCGLTR